MDFCYQVPEFNGFLDDSSNENQASIEAYFDSEHELNCITNGLHTEEVICNETLGESDYAELVEKDPLDICIKRSSSVSDLYKKPYYNRNRERGLSKNQRSSSNLSINKSCYLSRSKSSQSLVADTKKFISVAEAIKTFHMKTPDRFHTRSHLMKPQIKSALISIQPTIPASPFLTTKQRSRPTTVLSHDERENKEVEEMLKYKIKANPLNMRILAGPLKPKTLTVKKPNTIPQPFKITEVPKRAPVTPVQVIPQFHAQPLPKYIKDRSVTKSATPVVRAQMPSFLKHSETKKKLEFKVTEKPLEPLKPTKLEPFSFDDRDKELLKKKDKALEDLFEQEKKNREFHAKPVPKYITPSEGGNGTLYSKSSCNSLKNSSTESVTQPTFKAKPAKVLQMKPFEPQKAARPLVEIAQFNLNTESRAKNREAFQQKLKEKEEMLQHYLLTREEERLLKEEEEVRKLRKQAEHKAQPIRRYKAVETIVQKELTVPLSPNFHRNRNKENMST